MHQDSIITRCNRSMAAFTTGRLETIITMVRWGNLICLRSCMAVLAIGRGSMHFMTCMAIHAGHPALSEVNICFKILVFSEEFITNPTAVTCGAVIYHRWFSFEDVAIDKSSLDRCRSADMAVTT